MADNRGTEKFRWFFIGSGSIAARTSRELISSIKHEITYIFSRNFKTGSRLADQTGAVYVNSLEEADFSSIDGIYIATPQNTHFELISQCLRYKKPMLVEKPFVVNMREMNQVKKLSQEHDIIITEAMCMLFNPLLKQIKEECRRLAPIRIIKINYACAMMYLLRKPRLLDKNCAGGALLEIGTYAVSFCNYILDSQLKKISVQAKVKDGVDLGECINLDYEDTKCRLYISLQAFKGIPKAVVIGEKGKLTVPWFSNPDKYFVSVNGRRRYKMNAGKYIYEFDAFSDMVRNGCRDYDEVLKCTEKTIRCMDILRKEMGVVFPQDKKDGEE